MNNDGAKIACQRCGGCCLADFSAYVRDGDINRWVEEGRSDILAVLDTNIWMGDKVFSTTTGKQLERCSCLRSVDGQSTCSIYETRPQTCREYEPGSNFLCPFYPRP